MRKNKMEPWQKIKRKQQEKPFVYRDRRKQFRLITAISGFVIIVALLTFLRIPERIGMMSQPITENAKPSLQLTGIYKPLLSEIMDMEKKEDWDGDDLENGADLHPRDIDFDKNGISDGYKGKKTITGDTPVRYKNVKMIVSNSQSGIVKFRGDYYINSFAGWLAFENESGIPYIYHDNRWTKVRCKWVDKVCYIHVSGGCRIRFCEERKPDDRDVMIEKVPALYDNKPDERYSVANAPLDQLDKIYSDIDCGKTVQISIITSAGEQLLLVHGYDKDGNLIVADCNSMVDAGKVQIEICAQLFWNGRDISMRSWYEFIWGELSSENDDVLTVF